VDLFKVEKRKDCKSCKINFSLNCFPKKGKDRYELNCKTCHSLKKRNDRRSKPISKWCLSNISTQINWIEVESCSFTNGLYFVLKGQEYKGSNEKIQDVDHFLHRKNSIEMMLE
jgi:hypothetical protein